MLTVQNKGLFLQEFPKKLDCTYTAHEELIREISINIIYGLPLQAVQMTIRTFDKNVFKTILDRNVDHIFEKTQKPYFFTYHFFPSGNYDIQSFTNLRCPRSGFTIISSEARLNNSESIDHIIKVLNCLEQITPSVSEIAHNFFTLITRKETSWVKNCISVCKKKLHKSVSLPEDITTCILKFAIMDNGHLYDKQATVLLNSVLLCQEISLATLIGN